MSARLMYDGITPSRIPTTATLVAGYVDGKYKNVAEMKTRFPKAKVVEIAVFASTNAGIVLDVEPGDATATQAVGWVKMRRAAGVDPTVYCSASSWPAVKSAFHNAGVPEPHYWIAHYDGIQTVPNGAVAKQYQNTPGYDLSVVLPYWPGVDPKPVTHTATYEPFPGDGFFVVGRKSPIVAAMHKRLVAVGCNRYKSSQNIDTIGSGDIASYEAWQQEYNHQHHKGWTGADLKWPPGKETWNALQVPNV